MQNPTMPTFPFPRACDFKNAAASPISPIAFGQSSPPMSFPASSSFVATLPW